MYIDEFTLEPTHHGLELKRGAPRYKVKRRSEPLTSKPRRAPQLIGREEQIRSAGEVLLRAEPLEFYGQAGVGKTALLRYLAYDHPRSRVLNNVVLLGSKPVDDLLQDVFDVFYLSPQETDHIPTRAELHAAVGEVEALLVLDDPELTSDDLDELNQVATRCAVLLTSRHQRLWDFGHAATLTGLPTACAVRLFERTLRRPLTDDERPTVAALCELLQGFPWHVTRAAATVRDLGVEIDWLRSAMEDTQPQPTPAGSRRHAPLEPPARLSIHVERVLTDDQRKVVQELRALACPVHLRLFAVLSDATDFAHALDVLEDLGVVRSHSPVYSLRDEPTDEADEATFARVTGRLAAWADGHGDEVLAETRTLAPVLRQASRRQPQDAIRIARALDAALPPAGQWATWEAVLHDGITAAQLAASPEDEAFFRHQLGTRALCLGELGQAQLQLNRAREAREGDPAAQRLTDANLAVVERVVARAPALAHGPARTRARLWRLPALIVAAAAAAAGAVFVVGGQGSDPPPSLAWVPGGKVAESVTPKGTLKSPKVRYTNEVKLQAVTSDTVKGVRVEDAGPAASTGELPRFTVLRAQSTCVAGAEVAAGETCHVAVRVRPCGEGSSTATVVVDMEQGESLRFPVTSKPCGARPPDRGAAVDPDPDTPAVGSLKVSPGRLDFAGLAGETTEPKLVKVASTGATTDVKAQIESPANGFTLAKACSAPVSPKRPCTLEVTFTVKTSSPTSAILRIEGPGAPQDIPLTGKAVARRLSSSGPVTVKDGETKTVTLKNEGKAAAGLTKAEDVAGVKVDLGDCTAVQPGATCTLTVTSATLDDPVTITLSGPGQLQTQLQVQPADATPEPTPAETATETSTPVTTATEDPNG